MGGIRETLSRYMNKRKAERRLNNLFKSPQGFDRRKAQDRRLDGMPTMPIEPPE